VAEVAQRGLEVQRRQVVLGIADPGVAERGADAVPLRRAADEQVVDVARLVGRHVDELAETELAVAGGSLAPLRRPAVELGEEDAQRRGLELVEARVVADELERLLRLRAVEAQHPDPLSQVGVADRDEAAVAEPEEVLRRVEAEGRGDAGAAASSSSGGPSPASSSSGAGRPNRCTGTIAFVRGVIRSATSAGSRLSVAASISAKTGVASRRAIASAVA
jgi:hypothetical protein